MPADNEPAFGTADQLQYFSDRVLLRLQRTVSRVDVGTQYSEPGEATGGGQAPTDLSSPAPSLEDHKSTPIITGMHLASSTPFAIDKWYNTTESFSIVLLTPGPVRNLHVRKPTHGVIARLLSEVVLCTLHA